MEYVKSFTLIFKIFIDIKEFNYYKNTNSVCSTQFAYTQKQIKN